MIELGMSHIDFVVFSFQTEIMWVTAVVIAMAATSTVAAIANAVTLVNTMALLAAPIALVVQLIWVSCPQGTN